MSIISKLTAGAAVALAMTAIPALADGMPKKSYAAHHEGCDNRFGGAYIGGNVGWCTLNNRLTDRDGVHTNDEGAAADITHVQDGVTLGGSVSYNIQKCAAVFGVVADLSWADINSSRGYVNLTPGQAGPDRIQHHLDWYGSVRTRAGLAIDSLFLYTTGGIAFANAETRYQSQLNFNNQPVVGKLSNDGWRFGWVAGVGTEYAISDKISLTSEALYYDFGTKAGTVASTAGGGNPSQGFSFDDNRTMWVARMGVNFKLGARAESYEPVK